MEQKGREKDGGGGAKDATTAAAAEKSTGGFMQKMFSRRGYGKKAKTTESRPLHKPTRRQQAAAESANAGALGLPPALAGVRTDELRGCLKLVVQQDPKQSEGPIVQLTWDFLRALALPTLRARLLSCDASMLNERELHVAFDLRGGGMEVAGDAVKRLIGRVAGRYLIREVTSYAILQADSRHFIS